MPRDKAVKTIEEKIRDFHTAHPGVPMPSAPPPCPICGYSGYTSSPPDWKRRYCSCPRGQQLKAENDAFQARVAAELQEQWQAFYASRFEASGIKDKYRDISVDNLPRHLHAGRDKAIAIVRAMRDYGVAGLFSGRPCSSFIFHGPVGTGKSAMLAEICRGWIERRQTAMIVQWDRMIAEIQSSYGHGERDSWLDLITDSVRVGLLLIDDLGNPDSGREALSSDKMDKLYMLIDGRYAQNRPIVIATNLDRPGFKRLIGSRIADRLGEMGVYVAVNGENLREVLR